MRFVIEVDESWKVTVRRAAGGFSRERQLHSCVTPAGEKYPLPGTGDTAGLAEVPGDGSPAAISKAHSEIVDRTPADSRIFGRYLFHCLLGNSLWSALETEAQGHGADFVELALAFPDSDEALRSLPWEMMHGPSSFLAAGQGLRVAITRLVGKGATVPRTFPGITRILFVVGTSLHEETIRPGAEYLGLLRQLERDGQMLHSRVLERASAKRLKLAVASFRPDVVHFICHGGVDINGRGYLQLTTDEQDEPDERYAEQILEFLLSPEGELPPVAVLSACESGSLLAPERGSSLAAELVSGGIPIVVAMAGRVADRACRLFTRRFGEALVRGKNLVGATEEGRRVAFAEGESPQSSVDWAFPTLFLSPAVPERFTPVDGTAISVAREVGKRIQRLKIPRKPVFCGRHDFIEDFHELLESPNRSVLLVLAEDTKPGLGRTRLLQEMAAHALVEGHFPVLISTESPTFKWPKSVTDLGILVVDQILEARERVLGLGEGQDSDMFKLPTEGFDPGQLPADLSLSMKRSLRDGTVPAKLVRKILERDLMALAADARARFGDTGSVVVLLDEVQQYGSVAGELFSEMLDSQGLGSFDEKVSVVLSFSEASEVDSEVGPFLEKLKAQDWVHYRTLEKFRPGEDMLAYERVLFHPFAKEIHPGISDLPWQMDFESDPQLVEKYEKKYRKFLNQVPADFREGYFFVISEFATDDKFLCEADDEVALQRMSGGTP